MTQFVDGQSPLIKGKPVPVHALILEEINVSIHKEHIAAAGQVFSAVNSASMLPSNSTTLVAESIRFQAPTPHTRTGVHTPHKASLDLGLELRYSNREFFLDKNFSIGITR